MKGEPKFKLELHGPVKMDGFMKGDISKSFNDRCQAYLNEHHEEARRILREEGDEKALALLNQWIDNKHALSIPNAPNDPSNVRAHDLILWLCGKGCG